MLDVKRQHSKKTELGLVSMKHHWVSLNIWTKQESRNQQKNPRPTEEYSGQGVMIWEPGDWQKSAEDIAGSTRFYVCHQLQSYNFMMFYDFLHKMGY